MITNLLKKISLSTIIILLFVPSAYSWVQWTGHGDGTWQYRKPLTITSSSALSDYQVKLAFTDAGVAGLISGGKMQSNCQDVRFSLDDESTELSYWLDSTFPDANFFWLNIPSVANGVTVIYMYYGNPSATAVSDGDSTFELFDDFEGISLDTGKWQTWQVGPGTKNMSVSGGSLNLSAQGSEWTCSGIYTQATGNYSALIIEVKNMWDMSATNDTNKEVRITDAIPDQQDSGDQYRFDYYHSATKDKYRFVKNVAGVGSEQATAVVVNVNPTNYEWERYVMYSGNQLAYRSTDGINYNSLWTSAYSAVLNLPANLYLGYSVSEGYNVGAATAQLDWFRVRQYTATEPTVSSVGQEQEEGMPLPPEGLTILSNTSTTVTLSWTAGENNTKWDIERKENNDEFHKVAYGISVTTFTDSAWIVLVDSNTYAYRINLVVDATYHYRVHGYNDSDLKSEPSNEVSIGIKYDWYGGMEPVPATLIDLGCPPWHVIISSDAAAGDQVIMNPNPSGLLTEIAAANEKTGDLIIFEDSIVDLSLYSGGIPNTGTLISSAEIRVYYTDAELALNDLSADSLKIYLLDEELPEWNEVGGTSNTSERYVSVNIEHFSVYCLMGSLEDGDNNSGVYDILNYPNPFSTGTTFAYKVSFNPDTVSLRIYSLSGRLLKKIESNTAVMGYNDNFTWDGTDNNNPPQTLANGVYAYKITAESSENTASGIGKLVIAR